MGGEGGRKMGRGRRGMYLICQRYPTLVCYFIPLKLVIIKRDESVADEEAEEMSKELRISFNKKSMMR